jgi:hypothetical protein
MKLYLSIYPKNLKTIKMGQHPSVGYNSILKKVNCSIKFWWWFKKTEDILFTNSKTWIISETQTCLNPRACN